MNYVPIPISPNQQRARTVIILFRILIAVLLLNAIAETVMAYVTADRHNDLVFNFGPYITIGTVLIGLMRIVMTILMAVFFIMWMRRAYHNLHKAGLKHLRHSEGWAAGGWFVPFINFVYPIQIIREIFNETQNVFRLRDQPYTRQTDGIATGWWALLLISGFLSYGGTYNTQHQDLITGFLVGAISTFGYSIAAFLGMKMVERISKMEDEMMLRAQQYYTWMQMNYAQQMNQPAPTENPVGEIPQRSTDIDRFMPPTP